MKYKLRRSWKQLSTARKKHQSMQPPMTDKWWKWLRCSLLTGSQAGIGDTCETSPIHCPLQDSETRKDNALPHSLHLICFICGSLTGWLLDELAWSAKQPFWIFRENEVAVTGDSSKMYHGVLIPEQDQQVHRYLWKTWKLIKSLAFGEKDAPAMAQIALRRLHQREGFISRNCQGMTAGTTFSHSVHCV